MKIIYELFRAEIDKQKSIQRRADGRKLTNADIAKKTGFSVSTIHAFMGGGRASEQTAKAIAKALNIEM